MTLLSSERIELAADPYALYELSMAEGWGDGLPLLPPTEERVAASSLTRGNEVVCEAGDLIPSDGEVIEGIASVDESAITGESAPVIRESGGDR